MIIIIHWGWHSNQWYSVQDVPLIFCVLVNCRIRQPDMKPHVSSCKPCPLSASNPVCGSDGHNYASQVHRHVQIHTLNSQIHTKWCISTADFPILLNQEPNQIFIRVTRVKSVREKWKGGGLRGNERAESEGGRKRRWTGWCLHFALSLMCTRSKLKTIHKSINPAAGEWSAAQIIEGH